MRRAVLMGSLPCRYGPNIRGALVGCLALAATLALADAAVAASIIVVVQSTAGTAVETTSAQPNYALALYRADGITEVVQAVEEANQIEPALSRCPGRVDGELDAVGDAGFPGILSSGRDRAFGKRQRRQV